MHRIAIIASSMSEGGSSPIPPAGSGEETSMTAEQMKFQLEMKKLKMEERCLTAEMELEQEFYEQRVKEMVENADLLALQMKSSIKQMAR
ncbi:hypothetical protein lerEdw1_020122 [Lerista edwardsae]|nr:hypothetical protein lerEdw1_016488 [Lerista edwardsae]KAJ6658418.1 hypothetical protein lerEdw1_020122 [Lerista edwardsae]